MKSLNNQKYEITTNTTPHVTPYQSSSALQKGVPIILTSQQYNDMSKNVCTPSDDMILKRYNENNGYEKITSNNSTNRYNVGNVELHLTKHQESAYTGEKSYDLLLNKHLNKLNLKRIETSQQKSAKQPNKGVEGVGRKFEQRPSLESKVHMEILKSSIGLVSDMKRVNSMLSSTVLQQSNHNQRENINSQKVNKSHRW